MIASSLIDQLKSNFHGNLFTPGDQDYDAARKVSNVMIDRRPSAIARCGSPDVAHVLNLARPQDALVSVRGTGHNVAGYAVYDDGIVIDLSPMKNIEVDPTARMVRAGAGLT